MSENLVYIMQRKSGSKEVFVCDQYINQDYGNIMAKALDSVLLGVRAEGQEPIQLDTAYQFMLAKPYGPSNKLHYRQQDFPIFMKDDFAPSNTNGQEGSFVFSIKLPTMANNVYAVAQMSLDECYEDEFKEHIAKSPARFRLENGKVVCEILNGPEYELAAVD